MIASHTKDTPMGRLMAIMALQGSADTFESVCRTPDGHYLAQLSGDLGYNVYLGEPNPSPTDAANKRVQGIWNGFTATEQDAVLQIAAHPIDGEPIPLHTFIQIRY